MKTDDHVTGHKSVDKKNQKTLMKWTIKALPSDTLCMDIGMSIMTLAGLIAIANGVYENYFFHLLENEQSVFLSLRFGTVMTLMAIYLWTLVVRQKTIYRYTISDSFGVVESKLHFPKAAGTLFKSISIFFLFLLLA